MKRLVREFLDARLQDCMAMMADFPDGHFDLAIVDPPYGIGMGGGADWGTNTRTKHQKKTWDAEPPPAEYFVELRRVSKHQIIWGGNYFLDHLTSTKCFVVWDKMNGGNNMADCELAWTSFDSPVRKHTRHIFSGIGNTNYTSIHPTQKPVGLYDWLLSKYAKEGWRILDTHMGSGSIAIACHYARLHLTACEIDPDYFTASCARIERETAQESFCFPNDDYPEQLSGE
jgi:site-specific DNA-methyltransferase (adenine-specific)